MRVLVKAVELLASGRAQATVTFVSWFGLSKKDLVVKQQSNCRRWVRATGEPFGRDLHDTIDNAITRYSEYYDVKRPESEIEDLVKDLPKKIKRIRYSIVVNTNDDTEYEIRLPDADAYDLAKAREYAVVKVVTRASTASVGGPSTDLDTVSFYDLTLDARLFKSVHVKENTELVPVE